MKAHFRVADHPLLLEAVPGSLFTPVGPDLVECVCAVQSLMTDEGVAHASSARELLDTDGYISVVVVACRVEPGEPEYYPPGFTKVLPSAAPITFLSPSAPVQFLTTPLGGPLAVDRVVTIRTTLVRRTK